MSAKASIVAIVTLVLFLAMPIVGAHGGPDQAVGALPLPVLGASDGTEARQGGGAGIISSFPGTYGGTGAADDYKLEFLCPQIANIYNQDKNNMNVRCPADIIDALDILGNPVLVADPKVVDYMAFNSLHGGQGLQRPGNEPPTNLSRDNYVHQTHTVHYTADTDWAVWNDNPYYSPLAPPPSRSNAEDPVTFASATQVDGKKIYGTDNAMTLDAEGRVYLANIYAYKNFSDPKYDYAIAFWKSQRVNRPVDYFQGLKVVKLPPGVVADSIHLVYVRDTNRVMAMWRETNESSPQKQYITGQWTKPGQGAFWFPIKERQRIGECDSITNPIALRVTILIGCFAGKGYRMDSNATTGLLQIHGYETRGDQFTQRWIDQVPDLKYNSRTNALLVHRYGDSIEAVQGGLTPNGRPMLKISSGTSGTAWDPAIDDNGMVNDIMSNPRKAYRPPGLEPQEARITAASFMQRSGNTHIIYMERYKYANQAPPGAPEYFKGIVSIYHDGQFMGLTPLGVDSGKDYADPSKAGDTGRPTESYNPCQVYEARTQGPNRDVYNDIHDTILTWFNKAKEQREFVAYGDCGNIRFAEIREHQFIAFAIPFPPGIPPIPLAVAGANPAQVGAVAGALAGSMVLRMLAFKRKLAVTAPA